MDRVVLDTNVVFEGVTQRDSASGLLIEAWLQGVYTACISNALAYEYLDVLTRKLSEDRWTGIRHVLSAMLRRAEPIEIFFSWRPMSPDPADDAVVDCGMNGMATVVTRNVRDFHQAQRELGLRVQTPEKYLELLLSDQKEDS